MRETSAREPRIEPARPMRHGLVLLILLVVPAWSVAGCTRGEGQVMSETRDVETFTGIEVSGGNQRRERADR